MIGRPRPARAFVALGALALALSAHVPAAERAGAETRAGHSGDGLIRLVAPTTGDTSASAVVRSLRAAGVPLSFIAAARERPIALPARELRVADVLDSLVRQDPDYSLALVRGRIVIHPRDPKFYRLVTLPDGPFARVAQPEAARRYVSWLRAHERGFENWVAPAPQSPSAIAAAPSVSMSPLATVLDHLAEILGGDPTQVFTVLRDARGRYHIALETVSPEPR